MCNTSANIQLEFWNESRIDSYIKTKSNRSVKKINNDFIVNEIKLKSSNCCSDVQTLVSLQTDSKYPKKSFYIDDDTKKKLKKRAAAKFYTNQYLKYLVKLDSPLKKSYSNSLSCCDTIINIKGKLVSTYCKNRWCMVCNRIKTSNLISGYGSDLKNLEDKYFVTLSYENVVKEDLGIVFEHYNTFWRKYYNKKMDSTLPIRRLMKKSLKSGDYVLFQELKNKFDSIKLKGIKKIECTYNEKTNTYHPHIHILVSGKENAYEIRDKFLYYCYENNLNVHYKGQDVCKVDNGIIKELFKYFCKVESSVHENSKKVKKKSNGIFINAIDAMYCAMKGRQVYTSFGLEKDIVDEDSVTSMYCVSDEDFSFFRWHKNDWEELHDEFSLTGYIPSKYEIEREKKIYIEKKEVFFGNITVEYNLVI